jgi:hypothetical protein
MANTYNSKENYLLSFLVPFSSSLNNHFSTLQELEFKISKDIPREVEEQFRHSFYVVCRLRMDCWELLEDVAKQNDQVKPELARKIRECKKIVDYRCL